VCVRVCVCVCVCVCARARAPACACAQYLTATNARCNVAAARNPPPAQHSCAGRHHPVHPPTPSPATHTPLRGASGEPPSTLRERIAQLSADCSILQLLPGRINPPCRPRASTPRGVRARTHEPCRPPAPLHCRRRQWRCLCAAALHLLLLGSTAAALLLLAATGAHSSLSGWCVAVRLNKSAAPGPDHQHRAQPPAAGRAAPTSFHRLEAAHHDASLPRDQHCLNLVHKGPACRDVRAAAHEGSVVYRLAPQPACGWCVAAGHYCNIATGGYPLPRQDAPYHASRCCRLELGGMHGTHSSECVSSATLTCADGQVLPCHGAELEACSEGKDGQAPRGVR